MNWPAALSEYVVSENTIRLVPGSSRSTYRSPQRMCATALLTAGALGVLAAVPWHPLALIAVFLVASIAYIVWSPPAIITYDSVEITRHHNAWKFTRTRGRFVKVFELLDSRIAGAAVYADLYGNPGRGPGGGDGSYVIIPISCITEPFGYLDEQTPDIWTVGDGLHLEYAKLAALRDLFHPTGLSPMLTRRRR